MKLRDKNIIEEEGLKKKSFELYYNGGSIWCEHLDSMGDHKEEVIEKFLSDYKIFSKPSRTSFMIINLDNTKIDKDIVSCITDTIIASEKRFMKIALVGVRKLRERLAFEEIQMKKGCIINFFDDYEKAKQWVLP